MPAFDVEHLRKSIVQPLYAYEKKHDSTTLKEVQDSIRIALMMVTGFRDILDDLNYDEEKLRALQFNLDDNYDAVEKVFKTSSDLATREMIEKLLTQMTKLDMEIGDLILEHHHAG
jgi:hypothetical protein